MSNEDIAKPLAVAGIVIAVIVIAQPLSGDLMGISLNWIGAVLVAIGGVLGSLS
jgi:hypothetical protein